MKIVVALFMLHVCVMPNCLAQSNSKIAQPQRLKIGDTLPDMVLGHVWNYPQKSLRLSDLRGKLLIIDFWGVKCVVCLKGMPEMEALQKQFNEAIQIVLVTKDKDAQVEKLKKRIAVVRNVKLPMINEDSLLSRYFPYATVPTHVWIDEKGAVRQITQGWNTTALTIKRFLDGDKTRLPEKRESKDFDAEAPLWMEGGGRQVKNLKYYSYIMQRITDREGGAASYISDSVSQEVVGVKALNIPIVDLYRMAFSERKSRELMQPCRTLIESKDVLLNPPVGDRTKYEIWSKENTFCYELRVPLQKRSALFKIMREDLERFFDVRGHIEKRKIQCLVLRRKGADDRIQSIKAAVISEVSPDEKHLVIKNLPLSALMMQLEIIYWDSSYPLIDETEYKGNVDIELNGNLRNFKDLQEQFEKYGLQLKREERAMDMLVLEK